MAIFNTSQDTTATNSTKHSGSSSPPSVNILAPGAYIEGTINTESDLRVSGHVKGIVHVNGCCNVSPEGRMEGQITTVNARIGGHVIGELKATERVFLASTAVVEGNIRSARLIVEEGATFNGKSQMGESVQIVPAGAESDGETTDGVDQPRQLEMLNEE